MDSYLLIFTNAWPKVSQLKIHNNLKTFNNIFKNFKTLELLL